MLTLIFNPPSGIAPPPVVLLQGGVWSEQRRNLTFTETERPLSWQEPARPLTWREVKEGDS